MYEKLILPKGIDEDGKLSIIRRNLLPYYIHSLGLAQYQTVNELLSLCKKLEVNKLTADRSSYRSSLLEPDLSYKKGKRKNNREMFTEAALTEVSKC